MSTAYYGVGIINSPHARGGTKCRGAQSSEKFVGTIIDRPNERKGDYKREKIYLYISLCGNGVFHCGIIVVGGGKRGSSYRGC